MASGPPTIGVADPAEPLVATGTTTILAGTGAAALRDRLSGSREEGPVIAEDQDVQETEADDDVDELLVEEISIDGMCGVY